ncbi:MAG: hypothetical protein JWM34_4033 [Ilumatobacteraceae bacterium]|nr:hypothetical protein [Ilumatobacteraceae bacterium]
MRRFVRTILGIFAMAVLCAACNVDMSIDVMMRADGSGTVTVTATADADIVKQAPNLITDLRFDDVKAAGWTVQGPVATPTGGLQVVLTHTFATPTEANAILAGINGPSGPLNGVTLALAKAKDTTTYTLTGKLQVAGNLDAFSDADLFSTIGATPYAAQVAAANLQPAQAVTLHFQAKLPGSVKSSTATEGSASSPTGLSWAVPIDGTLVDVATISTHKDSKGNIWASPLAKTAMIAMFAWIVLAVGFIVYVVLARRRRAAIRALR